MCWELEFIDRHDLKHAILPENNGEIEANRREKEKNRHTGSKKVLY